MRLEIMSAQTVLLDMLRDLVATLVTLVKRGLTSPAAIVVIVLVDQWHHYLRQRHVQPVPKVLTRRSTGQIR